MRPVYVRGCGLWTPGFADALSWCRGVADPAVRAAPGRLLSGPLHRRASSLTRMAADAVEQAASAAARGPQGNGTWANLETNRAFAQALLALAIARQGRGEEAPAAHAPALRVYRDLKKQNADGGDFSHDFAICLYAHAVACAGTSGGRVERRTALDAAAQLLTTLSDEAKALRDVHDLIESIATERAKQKDKS